MDVGGGIGAQSLTLAKNCADLRFIIQDRPGVVQAAEKIWDEELPGARAVARVKMQGIVIPTTVAEYMLTQYIAHDFFTAQPMKNADVFLLRMILHDWPDAECLTILQYLRAAAQPSTQLVVVDNIMAYACRDTRQSDVLGTADVIRPPEPLLPDMGATNMISYLADVQVGRINLSVLISWFR